MEIEFDNTEYEALTKTNVSGFVFIIKHKYTLLIHGCFKTKEKAEKYTNGNIDYAIIKCKIE